LEFSVHDGSTYQTAESDVSLYDGRWYNVVGVYDGSDVKIYVDNVLQTDQPAVSGVTDSNIALNFGRNPGLSPGHYFDGSMDDVMILNEALNSSEISKLYGCAVISYTTLDSFNVSCFSDYPYGMAFFGVGAFCYNFKCDCLVDDDDSAGDDYFVLNTPYLSGGNYNVTYLSGFTGGGNESYQVLCGSMIYDFPDPIVGGGEINTTRSITCDFDLGYNEITFLSQGDGSVHFFSIEMEPLF